MNTDFSEFSFGYAAIREAESTPPMFIEPQAPRCYRR